MKKRFLAITLTVLLVLSLVPASALAADTTLISTATTTASNVKASLDNFKDAKEYTEGQFTDVKTTDWFADNVKAAFTKGMMNGNSATTFNPKGEVSFAETIAIAARINSIYNTGVTVADGTGTEAWYAPAETYAIANGIIKEAKASSKAITRAEFAQILAKALPDEALEEKNNIVDGIIPDVAADADYAEAVYKLYRAGIMIGDTDGKFKPDTKITRAEMAAVITRMADKTLRLASTFQYGRLIQLEDNLYEATFDTLDYDFAQKYFDTYYGGPAGCSVIYKDGRLMRNYDWYINMNGNGTEQPSTVIVHTTASDGRYATVGVGSAPSLNAGNYQNISATLQKLIPFLTVDIMNSEGLVVSESSVPGNDFISNTDGSQGKEITRGEYTMMRYIADYCATVDEAIEYIQSVNYYALDLGYGTYREEIHFMVADEDEVAIIEYIDGEPTVLRESKLEGETFMTNHYRYVGTDVDTGHGTGFERDVIIRENYKSVVDQQTGMDLLSKISYSHSYTIDPTDEEHFWWSEYAGYYDVTGNGDWYSVSWSTPHDDKVLQYNVQAGIAQYNSEENAYSWYTEHSSVYDTKTLQLLMCCQEQYDQTYSVGIVQANPTK